MWIQSHLRPTHHQHVRPSLSRLEIIRRSTIIAILSLSSSLDDASTFPLLFVKIPATISNESTAISDIFVVLERTLITNIDKGAVALLALADELGIVGAMAVKTIGTTFEVHEYPLNPTARFLYQTSLDITCCLALLL